jgi:hypothetical protein
MVVTEGTDPALGDDPELAHLKLHWHRAYDIRRDESRGKTTWIAQAKRDRSIVLKAATSTELGMKIRADYLHFKDTHEH